MSLSKKKLSTKKNPISTKKTLKQEPAKPIKPFSEYRKSVDAVIRKSFKSRPSSRQPSILVNDNAETNKNISYKYEGDGKYIPKFKIVNSPGCASVIVSLNKGQSVYCNYASMNYCDGTVDISTKSQGIFSSIIRKFFTTSSFFLNYYTGIDDRESVAAFASYFPGDIIAMRIKKGEKYIMSSHGFLCATPNVKLSTTTRLRNIIVRNEDAFLNEVSIMDDCTDDGMVWISAHGGFDKVEVKAGETVKVNGGIFAFTKSENNFTLSTEGNIKSFLFSGQTILMLFTGPCELYVHSQNFTEYIAYMTRMMTNIAGKAISDLERKQRIHNINMGATGSPT
jgi:uncharacterized protein (AIM24 family)